MKCPKCKSKNVRVQMMEVGSSTKRSGVGLFGNTYNAARGLASIATLGIAGKVLPKAQGKNKTKVETETFAVCQDCGHSWKV